MMEAFSTEALWKTQRVYNSGSPLTVGPNSQPHHPPTQPHNHLATLSHSESPHLALSILDQYLGVIIPPTSTMAAKRKADANSSPRALKSAKTDAGNRRVTRSMSKPASNSTTDTTEDTPLTTTPETSNTLHRSFDRFEGKIVCEGRNAYLIVVSLDDMSAIRKQAWGVFAWATNITVRVATVSRKGHQTSVDETVKFRGLCTHLASDSEEKAHRPLKTHKVALVAEKWYTMEDKSFCGLTHTNLLTHLLRKKLHKDFKSRNMSLSELYDVVSEFVNTTDPTTNCVVCDQEHSARIWRPGPCSEECTALMADLPLPALLSPLLVDIKALDLLLCCVYTAANGNDKLAGCPLLCSELVRTLDALPMIESKTTVRTLLGYGKRYKNRHALFSWLAKTFMGCIMSAPATAHLPSMPNGTHQFLITNLKPQQTDTFHSRVPAGAGIPAFNGVDGVNALDILVRGFQKSTCFSKDLSTLMGGEKEPLTPWPNSTFQKSHVMFGLECTLPIDGHNPNAVVYVSGTRTWLTARQPDGGLVMPRYMFLFQRTKGALLDRSEPWKDEGEEIAKVMRATLKAIRSGDEQSLLANADNEAVTMVDTEKDTEKDTKKDTTEKGTVKDTTEKDTTEKDATEKDTAEKDTTEKDTTDKGTEQGTEKDTEQSTEQGTEKD